jgi:hypothetical protein
MCSSMEEVLAESEVVVIGNRAPEFAPVLQMTGNGRVVIDLVRLVKNQEHAGQSYQGICW